MATLGKGSFYRRPNSERVASAFFNREAAQTFQGCVFYSSHTVNPRVAKAQPWAEISERFQRYHDPHGAYDDKFVYWNAGGNIVRISKEGGKPETVAADHVGIGIDLAVDNEKVYWTNHGYYSANSPPKPSPIYVVAKQGGKVETFSADQNIRKGTAFSHGAAAEPRSVD